MQACDKISGSFDVTEYTNYASWLPMHVHDMVELAKKHHQVHAEFLKDTFVSLQNSVRRFSLIASDKAHEQYNKNSRHVVKLL